VVVVTNVVFCYSVKVLGHADQISLSAGPDVAPVVLELEPKLRLLVLGTIMKFAGREDFKNPIKLGEPCYSEAVS
jgi:hypothetical protein